MRVRTTRDLAEAARDCRRRRGWSQSQLAVAAGVGRDWVIQFEKGKSTVELGFVLRVLETLELPLRLDADAEITEGETMSLEEQWPVAPEHPYQLPTNLL